MVAVDEAVPARARREGELRAGAVGTEAVHDGVQRGRVVGLPGRAGLVGDAQAPPLSLLPCGPQAAYACSCRSDGVDPGGGAAALRAEASTDRGANNGTPTELRR